MVDRAGELVALARCDTAIGISPNVALGKGRTATLDELASAYLFLMKNDFITGQQLAVDGGIMLG